MATEAQKVFLKQMQEILSEHYETKLEEESFIFLLSDVGLRQSKVRGDMLFYEEDCDLGEQPSGLLQLYFTVAEYQEKDTVVLQQRLAEVTEKALLGHFGLYEPLHHIYYRDTVLLPDLNHPISHQMTCIALAKMAAVLEGYYNYFTIIGQDVSAITLDGYIAEMRNLQEVMHNPKMRKEILEELGND